MDRMESLKTAKLPSLTSPRILPEQTALAQEMEQEIELETERVREEEQKEE